MRAVAFVLVSLVRIDFLSAVLAPLYGNCTFISNSYCQDDVDPAANKPYGSPFTVTQTSTAAACQQSCLSNVLCNQFTWDSSNLNCVTSHYSDPLSTLCDTNTNGYSYACQPQVTLIPYNTCLYMANGVCTDSDGSSGLSLSALTLSSAGDCQTACLGNSHCNHATWNSTSKVCSLNSFTNALSTTCGQQTTAYSYACSPQVSSVSSGTCLYINAGFCIDTNGAYVSNYGPLSSLQQCQSQCIQNPSCNVIVFDHVYQQCYWGLFANPLSTLCDSNFRGASYACAQFTSSSATPFSSSKIPFSSSLVPFSSSRSPYSSSSVAYVCVSLSVASTSSSAALANASSVVDTDACALSCSVTPSCIAFVYTQQGGVCQLLPTIQFTNTKLTNAWTCVYGPTVFSSDGALAHGGFLVNTFS